MVSIPSLNGKTCGLETCSWHYYISNFNHLNDTGCVTKIFYKLYIYMCMYVCEDSVGSIPCTSCMLLNQPCIYLKEWDRGRCVAQAVDHLPVTVGIVWLSLHGGCICSLSYFPFQTVVYSWSIKDCGMCCPVCGKVHSKDPLLFIWKSSPCGDSRFPLKEICHNDHMIDVQ